MNIRPFEAVLIAVFFILGIAGVIYLSLYKGGDDSEEKIYGEQVTLWGTIEDDVMSRILTEATEEDGALKAVKYREVDPRSFDGELLNAIAEGRAPDLIIMPHTSLVTHRAKLLPISYEALPERTFRDTYVDGAEIFMTNEGTYGIPLTVDPLVMFWNRDIFSSAGLAQPPKTWEDLVSVTTPAITHTDAGRDLSQSALAFGEYSNVLHAKDVLSMLLFQAGTNIVEERGGLYTITLNQEATGNIPPADAVLSFYTQFSNPTQMAYTWNRTLPLDQNAFTGGTLAMYFGNASEIAVMEAKNPNLNFDIAPVPQGSGATTYRNYGTFYAFAIPRTSANASGAYNAALALSNERNMTRFTGELNLAPARRSLYTSVAPTSYSNIIRQSALIARGWLDPAPRESGEIFRTMVEDVSTGRARTAAVITDAAFKLEALFR